MKEKTEYGEAYQEHLLEQYKMYVETADKVSSNRIQSNQFYISVLSGLLAFLSFVVTRESFSDVSDMLFITISLIGILLCCVWYTNINSYKQLNKLKFTVIHKMEQELPFACFDQEWETEKETKNKYIRLTRVENYVPIIMVIPYLILIMYAFFRLIG